MKRLPKLLLAASVSAFVATGCLTLIQSATPAYAAERNGKEKDKKEETRHLQTMSQAVYAIIEKANKALDAKMYDDAIKYCNEALARKGLNEYEQVVSLQIRSYSQYYKDDVKDASAGFEKILAIGATAEGLPDGLIDSIRYNLAQIYVVNGQYDKSIALLKQWLQTAANPSPDAYILLGQAYAQQEKYKDAIPWYEKAIDVAKAQNKDISKDWYQNLGSMYMLTEQYKKAEPIWELLCEKWPNKNFMVTLANLYGLVKREKEMLGIFDALYRQGKLDKSTEIIQLSQLWQYHDAPYRGAVILKKGIESGIVEKNAKNLESLANAYVASDEIEKAIPFMTQAAALSKDGNLYVQLAQAYIQDEKWNQAADALQKGFDKGNVDNKAQAQYLLGITQYNLAKYNDAKRTFALCQSDKSLGKNCQQYLQAIRQKESQS
jgi:tetratricopeptide (TPR) repeat protein